MSKGNYIQMAAFGLMELAILLLVQPKKHIFAPLFMAVITKKNQEFGELEDLKLFGNFQFHWLILILLQLIYQKLKQTPKIKAFIFLPLVLMDIIFTLNLMELLMFIK